MRIRNTSRCWMLSVLILLLLPFLALSVAAEDGSVLSTIEISANGANVPLLQEISPEEHVYEAVLPNNADKATIFATATGEGATVKINDAVIPETGFVVDVPVSSSAAPYVTLEIEVSYKIDFQKFSNIYELHLYRKPDANLKSLDVLNGTYKLLKDFSSDKHDYSITVENGVYSLIYSAQGYAEDAQIQLLSGSFVDLAVGENKMAILVTSGKGKPYEVSSLYTVTVKRLQDARLQSVKIIGSDGVDYTPEHFHGDVMDYEIEVPNEVTSLTITGTEAVVYSTPIFIEVSSSAKALMIGSNEVEVIASRADGSQIEYMFQVKRDTKGSNVSTLDNLKLQMDDGALIALSPAFSKDVLEYSAIVHNEIERVNVVALMTDPDTESYLIAGDTDLKVGENTISVFVYAEDTTYTKYVIHVTRKSIEMLSKDSSLSALTVDGIMLVPVFSTQNLLYAIDVPATTTSLVVNATASDANATVEITGNENLPVGTSDVKITVTAEDGTTKSEYVISVTRPKSDTEKDNDPNLKNLYLVDAETNKRIAMEPAFDMNVTEYTAAAENIAQVKVKASNNGKKGIWMVGRTSGSTVDVTEGENTIKITSKAEDGTKKVYTIVLTVSNSGSSADPVTSDKEATLSAIQLSGGAALTPAFDPNVFDYVVNVPNSMTSITITGTPTSSKAAVTNRELTLNEGDNPTTLIVVSGDQTASNTYTIHVYRTPAQKELSGSLSITGSFKVGETLTASFVSSDKDATVTFAWYISGSQIGVGETYLVKEADAGKTIYAVATGTGIYNGSVSSKSEKIEEVAPETTVPETSTEPLAPQEPDAKLPPIVVILIVVGGVGLIVGFAFFVFGKRK